MKRLTLAVAVFVSLVATTHSEAQEQAGLNQYPVLALTTKLGVAQRISVAETRTGDSLLDRLGAGCGWGKGYWRKASDPMLAIQTGDGTFVLVPWRLLRGVSIKDGKQVVILDDSTSYAGTIKTTAFVAGDSDQNLPYSERKKYDLSTAKTLTLVHMPPRVAPKDLHGRREMVRRVRGRGARREKTWMLPVLGQNGRLKVTSPRFAFKYYTSAGYIMGGTNKVAVTGTFVLNVDGDQIAANLEDFAFLGFDSRNPKKAMVSVRAEGASTVTGELELVAEDSKGSHAASAWVLAVDMNNGCRLVFSRPNLTLEQVAQASTEPTKSSNVPNSAYHPHAADETAVENAEGDQPAENVAKSARQAEGLRTWTDKSGKYTVEGEFRGFVMGQVRIQTKHGRSIDVPLGRLSPADQKFVEKTVAGRTTPKD